MSYHTHETAKFIITPKAYNKKLGPIMVTMSPRSTCPITCPFSARATGELSGLCYAEHGFIGQYIWGALDRLGIGETFKSDQIEVQSLEQLVHAIRSLPEGTLWRHNQAGDLQSELGNRRSICSVSLGRLVKANIGRRGFTYTHFDIQNSQHNRECVASANAEGFAVNLSADSVEHADELADLNVAPIAVTLPAAQLTNFKTPRGRTVVICPAVTHSTATCASCGLCARPRSTIIGFPAVGQNKYRVSPLPHTATNYGD